jgi:hypothetical protein
MVLNDVLLTHFGNVHSLTRHLRQRIITDTLASPGSHWYPSVLQTFHEISPNTSRIHANRDEIIYLQSKTSKTELVLSASRCFQLVLPANGWFHYPFAGNLEMSEKAPFAVPRQSFASYRGTRMGKVTGWGGIRDDRAIIMSHRNRSRQFWVKGASDSQTTSFWLSAGSDRRGLEYTALKVGDAE